MPSPFPGMDPYLEDPAYWPDFHHTFITCWREAIVDLLPANYDARIDERVNLVQMSPEVVKRIYPDIAVSRLSPSLREKGAEGHVAVLEPETVPQDFVEEVRQSHIEILHRPERSLIAVLELLSPTNKAGEGYLQYKSKRTAVLQQNVHLFELDLLLGGQPPSFARALPNGDYHAFLTRAESRASCQVYAWAMRRPLPTVPVPLLAPDADLSVDLQTVFQLAYERGRYARSLSYRQPPVVGLSDEDKSWVLQRTSGLSTS